jgi:hypothetical protein
MALELNATCSICGNRYHVCNSCKEVKSFQAWRTVTDTLPHYVIYLALHEYTIAKDKTKAKTVAKEELSKCDLSELESWDEDVKTAIKEIMDIKDSSEKEITNKAEEKITETKTESKTSSQKK